MQKSSTLQDSESGERKYSILAPKNPPTPLAVQGVLGAGQAGIIVSQSSHRNQFIALVGGRPFFVSGKNVLHLEGHGGERFGGTFLDYFCKNPNKPKSEHPRC